MPLILNIMQHINIIFFILSKSHKLKEISADAVTVEKQIHWEKRVFPNHNFFILFYNSVHFKIYRSDLTFFGQKQCGLVLTP